MENIVISAEAAEKLISSGCGSAALLYIGILKNSGAVPDELKFSRSELGEALGVLMSLGLVSASINPVPAAPAPEPPAQPPEPPAPEPEPAPKAQRPPKSDAAFSHLVGEIQRRLGKILSSSDLERVANLYTNLHIPADVLSVLVSCCIDEARLRGGEGALPSVRKIESEGYRWRELGINTLPEAMRYLRESGQRRDRLRELCAVLKLSGEKLGASTEKAMSEWIDMGFGNDAVAYAYELTVEKLGELRLSYLSGILRKWHSRGLHSIDEIRAATGGTKTTAAQKAPSGKLGASEREAMELMRAYRKKEEG